MASKIVIRTMLIAALVVTAHAIKPFSFGNVTLHVLGAARSLSFAMPEAAAERIEHAHHLAQIYGKGLFDDDAASIWAKKSLLHSELAAFANPVELNYDAEIKDVKSSDSSRKPAQKRPVKRIKRDENRDEDSGCSKTNEIARLPEVQPLKTIALVPPTDVQADMQAYQLETIAALNQHTHRLTSLRIEWVLISKPLVVTSLCRDASVTKTEIVEAPIEIVIGPEEEENFVAEPEQVAPVATTAMPIPECIRIP